MIVDEDIDQNYQWGHWSKLLSMGILINMIFINVDIDQNYQCGYWSKWSIWMLIKMMSYNRNYFRWKGGRAVQMGGEFRFHFQTRYHLLRSSYLSFFLTLILILILTDWRWRLEDDDLFFSFTRPWRLKDQRFYQIEEGTTHLVSFFSFSVHTLSTHGPRYMFMCKVWATGRGPLYAAPGLNITDPNTATSAGLSTLSSSLSSLRVQAWRGWGCSLWKRRRRTMRVARSTSCRVWGPRWRPVTPPTGAPSTGVDTPKCQKLRDYLGIYSQHGRG